MTVLTPPERPARVRPPAPKRLGKNARKVWLIVHIVSAGAWLGMDVVMGVLVFTAMLTDDPATVSFSYQALELFAIWPLVATGLICLVSGIVLGIGSKYGLVRYWWVAVKLVLTIVLCALVLFSLRPGVHAAAEYGRTMIGDASGDMAFPPIVSTISLLFATAISVFKPWGRTRRSES